MPGKYLFEYAVIRIVPRVEREEILNVGVIVYCKESKYLETRFIVDEKRLNAFAGYLDTKELEEHLDAFKKISRGDPSAGEIARLEPALRFRWLTATRSTIVQTSKVHPGFCSDLDGELDKLFNKLVLM